MLVGNLLDIDAAHPIESLAELAREYGPIFELDVPGRVALRGVGLRAGRPAVRQIALRQEGGGRVEVRWPGVRPAAVCSPPKRRTRTGARRTMCCYPPSAWTRCAATYPRMLDIAVQLMQKWDRLNPDDVVDVPADMTRLTLDTIALCGFDYRFNSFYRDTPHPFVVAMLGSLEAAQAQARELPLQRQLHPRRDRKLRADQELMVQTVQHLIEERRRSGALGTINDLLDRMLTGVDRQSGEKLDETNIIAQCITFLIAGHETTSGLLSFALYALIKNPEGRSSGATRRWTGCWARI